MSIQDALDYCLANPDRLSIDELLEKFPEYREELQPLLVLTLDIATLDVPVVPAARRAAMKQRLMSTASQPVTRHIAATTPRWRESLAALIRRPVWAGALAAVLLIAVLWWSTANSLPGNPLYPVKLTAESTSRGASGSTVAQIDSYLRSAGTRLREIDELRRRGQIADAAPAIESYRSSIEGSSRLWEQTQGQAHTDLAKTLYVSAVQGAVSISSIVPDLAQAPAPVRSEASETLTALDRVRASTGNTLAAANIDANLLLLDAGIDPDVVPTPLNQAALATATATLPVLAVATPFPTATDPPVVSVGSTQTALAISARQTALAASTEAPSPVIVLTIRPTNTVAVAPPTATQVRRSATLVPPTSARPTNTRQPAPATATRRPTNTRIVPQPTELATLVPTRTVGGLPTLPIPTVRPTHTTPPAPTQAPPTVSQPTASPVRPTDTPIIMPTVGQLPTFTPVVTVVIPTQGIPTPDLTPPLPTVTAVPPLPTIVPLTPPPLPTLTPIVLPTLTLPPLPVTPIPIPTLVECEIEIENIEISCGPGVCIDFSVTVANGRPVRVRGTWNAELRVKIGGGGYYTFATMNGTEELEPGQTVIEELFCNTPPPGTTHVQVRFSLTTLDGCRVGITSGAIPPCADLRIP